MRRPTKALTAATLVVALSTTIIRGQQSSRGTPSATGNEAPSSTTPGSGSSMSGRSARSLLRNGQDYLGYQEYNRALKYLREAETRQAELNDAEKQDLKAAVEKAMTGLRSPANSSTARYAKGPSKRPGAIALAKPPGQDKQVQLASAHVPQPKAEDGTPLPYLPKEEAILPPAEVISILANRVPVVAEPPALPLGSEPVVEPTLLSASPVALTSTALPTVVESDPPLPLLPLASVDTPTATAPAEIVVPAAVAQTTVDPLPLTDEPVRQTTATLPLLPPTEDERSPDPSPLPPLPETQTPAQQIADPVPVPAVEPTFVEAAPVPTPAPEPLPPLPDQPPLPPEAAVVGEAASEIVQDIPVVDPPLPEEVDALPPLPVTSADNSAPEPVGLPVTPRPAPRPEMVAPIPNGMVPGDNSAFFRRPVVKIDSTLSPELRQEVEKLARAQDDAARLNPPTNILSTDPNDYNRRSALLMIPRAPSPTEARPIKAIPVPEDFQPHQARQWEPQRKYWSAAATCHGPLYFQDASLERYGHSVETFFGGAGRYMTYPIDDPKQSKQRIQILQPIFSAGLFAGQIAALPYNLIVDPIWEPEYDLGYYRPGDRVPKDVYYLPWRGVGGIFGHH